METGVDQNETWKLVFPKMKLGFDWNQTCFRLESKFVLTKTFSNKEEKTFLNKEQKRFQMKSKNVFK